MRLGVTVWYPLGIAWVVLAMIASVGVKSGASIWEFGRGRVNPIVSRIGTTNVTVSGPPAAVRPTILLRHRRHWQKLTAGSLCLCGELVRSQLPPGTSVALG